MDLSPHGRVWLNGSFPNVNQETARKYCNELYSGTLPSEQDFRTAERNGFREVIGEMSGLNLWADDSRYIGYGLFTTEYGASFKVGQRTYNSELKSRHEGMSAICILRQ